MRRAFGFPFFLVKRAQRSKQLQMRFKAHRIDATYPLGQVMACGTQHCVRAHLLEKASERLAACYMTAERCAGKQLLEGSIKRARPLPAVPADISSDWAFLFDAHW